MAVDLLERARSCSDPELRRRLLALWRERVFGESSSPKPAPAQHESVEAKIRKARAKLLHSELSGCTACELSKSRTRVVPWSGPVPAKLAVVGEAPGYHEDEKGEPFVGKAGALLDKMLLGVGLRREEVFVTNACLCRPPKNAKPTPEQIRACLPHLRAQLDLSEAPIVVAMGNTAIEALGIPGPISRVQGTTAWKDGRLVLATYHPAAALRDPSLQGLIEADLRKAAGWVGRLPGRDTDLDPRPDLEADRAFWREVLLCAWLESPEAHPWLHYLRCMGATIWPCLDGYAIGLPEGLPESAVEWPRRNPSALQRVRLLRWGWVQRVTEPPTEVAMRPRPEGGASA